MAFDAKRSTWLVLAVCCCALTTEAQAPVRESTIRGIVVDSGNAPLGGVEVFAPGTDARLTTNQRGEFRISELPSGRYLVIARRTGFAPDSNRITLAGNDSAIVRLVLRPIPTPLEEVEVRAAAAVPPRLEGFEHRRQRQAGGHFITAADIARRPPWATSELLRGIQGVTVVDSMGVAVAVSTRGLKLMPRRGVPVQCVMRVGLDGYLKDASFQINQVSPGDIHGIEIYSGPASIPAEFGGARADAYCGLIMIWTK